MWVWLSAIIGVVVIAAVAVVLFVKPAILVPKKLSHSAVEQTIKDGSQPYGGYSNVICNDGKNITLKAGTTFSCVADGNINITVTINTSSGDYVWQPNG